MKKYIHVANIATVNLLCGGFQEGAEYCEKVLYKKMLRYLQEHLMDWVDEDGDPVTESIQNMTKEKFIKDFCNYIENKKI